MDTIKRLKSKEVKTSQQSLIQNNKLNILEQLNQKSRIQVKQEGLQIPAIVQVPQSLGVNKSSSSNNLMDQTAQIYIQKQDSSSGKSSKSSSSHINEISYLKMNQSSLNINDKIEPITEEPIDEHLDFKYQKLLDVITGSGDKNKLGFLQQKIDYLTMISNRLQISLFDLLNLLPSKYLAQLFQDYKQQENVMVSMILASVSGLSQPNKIFEDIKIDLGDKFDYENQYLKAHCQNYEECLNQEEQEQQSLEDDEEQEELTPQIKTRIFFSRYIIPLVLHQLIDFKQDPSMQMNSILGRLEEIYALQQSQTSLGSAQNINTQDSGGSLSQNSNASQNLFHQKVYITNLREFYRSLKFFMEKIYRKNNDKAQYVLSYLQKICKNDRDYELDQTLFSYEDLKRDRVVLYRLAMSGTKKLLFNYLQDKQILTKYAGHCIFDFKKKEIFLDYYKRFITPVEASLSNGMDDTVFRISANLENYCRALQTSQHKICALRNAIALIRFLTPFLETFSSQFNQSATNKYLIKAACWRIVRFILFVHDGSISYVALVFLIFNFEKLFSERSLLNQEHERFLHLLLAFLHVYRNREDDLFKHSQQVATKIIMKLIKKINQNSEGDSSSLSSSRKKINIQTSSKSSISSKSSEFASNNQLKDYWLLNYNYPSLDEKFKKYFAYLQLKEIESKYNYIEKELKSIQEQPLIDEQVILILSYLKNLLQVPQDFSSIKLSKSILEELKNKNLNETQLKKEKERLLYIHNSSIKEKKNAIYLQLLNLPKLSDNKKILAKNSHSMNALVKIKQELLVDCLGLIGPVQQHDYQENYQDILPINLTPADLKEKIKSFLNVNIFNTDIPLVSLCICKEYVENKFTGKRKKLNERIQNSFLSANEASKSQDDMDERSNMLNASFSSRGINENGNGNATNLDYSFINQQKQQFKLMQWLAELIMKMKKQDETIKIIEGCMELMANSDLGEFLTPYIIFKYINSTENSYQEIIPVINKILEEGHHNHKLIITKTLINLDTWFRQELKQEKQQNYDPFRPQSIMHSESPKNRFIRNFAFIKRGISTQVYCKTLVEMSEHKSAIQLLEQELEQQEIQLLNITDSQEIKNIKKLRTHYIYQLYNIYKEVNEDYKNIDVVEMMRKLELDDTEIKKYQDINLKQKSDGLCSEIYEDVVDRNFRDEESQQKLINLLSKSIPDFASQNQDFAFQKYLRSICWGFQKILNYEKNNSFDNMFQQLKSAIQKLKYAFSLQLVNAKNCYDSKFSVLVKIQVLLNVETMLKIQKFQKDYSKFVKNGDIIFDQTSFSYDESQPDYLLKLTVKANSQGFPINGASSSSSANRITYNQIITQHSVFNLVQTLTQTSKLQLSYDQECYLRIVYNYLICVLYNQCKEYRKIYINSLFRLSRYYYKKEKYSDALTILKRAKKVWKEKKDSFSSQEIYTLQAKIEKKLGNIKKAIHKLQKFDGIDFKIKKITYKYQHNFQIFSEQLIHSEFVKLVQANCESEKLCFKYAKFIDENELISDNPNEKEIDQKIKAIQLYLLAASNGHQYIHQSLPRAIRLLVELFQDLANLQSKKAQLVKQKFEKNFVQISETCNKIEVFKLTSVVNQLTSHITIPNEQCANLFIDLLAKVGAQYPDQSVWWLLPLRYMYQMISNQSTVQKDDFTEARAGLILKKICEINKKSYDQIQSVSNFYYNLLNFAIKVPDGSSSTMKIENYLVKSLANLKLILPKKEYIFPQMPSSKVVDPNHNPYHPDPVYMEKFDDVVRIMSSKQKPKLLTVQCSDGSKKKFLIKSQTQSENVYEQRTSELISFLNLILSKEKLGIYEMPSYTILRLNSQSCIVEWVDDTLTLKSILDQLWQEKKQKSQFYQLRLDSDKLSRDEWNKQKNLPSVFQDFFNQRFLDSQMWYSAKENYLKTYASWCILGYLIGLGDRHTDNILIKRTNGEIIHIDYALIFGSGKQLNVPETIPFRLTKNMEFALGSFKSYGLFRKAMIDICMCFSKHLDDIIGFWDCFTNELEGCKKTNFNQLCNQIKNRIKMTNFKSTEEGIDSLIQISKDDYCLRDMFKGWWPHA